MTGPSDAEAREFAATFQSFLDWVHSGSARGEPRNEVVALVGDFLGETAHEQSVVGRTLPVFEHVNLQTALNAWSAEAGRTVDVRGIAIPPRFGPISLQQLVNGEGMPHLRLSAPPLADLPNGPDSTLACLQFAALLVTDSTGRYVVLVRGPSEHERSLSLEIAGLSVQAAQAVHARIGELRSELNVYRGHLLEVGLSPGGGITLEFSGNRVTQRDEVILPEAVLGRVERHALGVATHREALLAAGQHLKRGLLLYGPPGTGKTHTTRYLMSQLSGYTRLMLTGRSLNAIGGASDIARDLAPSAIVLEDVDLVAEDRTFGPGSTPVLFELLDAMDGAAPDADLVFVLTTNRADLLEPALAARPGRIDVAIEIGLPNAEARRRLLALYGRALPMSLSDSEVEEIIERSEGVTASFIKELLRRAMLESVQADPAAAMVTAVHTTRALDDLLDTTQQLTRSLLGVGNDPSSLPAGGGIGTLPPVRGADGRSGRGARRF